MSDTFIIPVDFFQEFKEKIAKLNRKAIKLDCDPITFINLGEKIVERSYVSKFEGVEHTRTYKVPAYEIELHGSAPKLEGFEFVARIEYLQDHKSTLFHTVPGSSYKIDERFRDLTPETCEHCNRIRRRNDTFVVREIATGKQTQVGRQCLADFTGSNTPEKVAQRASFLTVYEDMRDDEDRMWRSHFENTIDTHEALALTSAYIGEFGWVPKSQGEFHNPTAYQVQNHFSGWSGSSEEERKFLRSMKTKATEEMHQDRATKTVEWIKNDLASHAKSDYEHNLVTLVVNDLCEPKHLGIVCSAVAAYQRAMNQKVEYAQRQVELKNSQYVGKIGERMKGLKVTVRNVRSFEGSFGPVTMVKFLTNDGNMLTWFASSDKDFSQGSEMTIDASIKGYKEYQGIKETQVTRVKVK